MDDQNRNKRGDSRNGNGSGNGGGNGSGSNHTVTIGFSGLLIVLLCFAGITAIVLIERRGVQYALGSQVMDYLPASVLNAPILEPETTCLILTDGANLSCHQNIVFSLDRMCVGFDVADVTAGEIPNLYNYDTVVLTFSNLAYLGNGIITLFDWVRDGGGLMFSITPELNSALLLISARIGIIYTNLNYVMVESAHFLTDLLPGGKGLAFEWSNPETDMYRDALNAVLDGDCTIYLMGNAGDMEVPLLWSRSFGKGRIVVNNNDEISNRWSRGMAVASYSLLQEAFAYPVINASVFFIDDFPSPVPAGEAEYIERDYKTSVDYFYTNIWFPDIMDLAHQFGLKYTAAFLQDYGDSVEPPFDAAPDPARFKYFGSILMDEGFEIGLHGYNHQPFVLPEFAYQGEFYIKWNDRETMADSLRSVNRYFKELFPQSELQTYVPPSNILSPDGREVVHQTLPGIKTISGLYVDEIYYSQHEFETTPDGLINFPRISSGFTLGEEDLWFILNELTFQYVNSHFFHPDDTLDIERGAEAGWEQMRDDFQRHLSWLASSAKMLRNVTAQEASMATQRYDTLRIRSSLVGDRLVLDLYRFYDEAWFLVRFNAGVPVSVVDGTLTQIKENLYLLQATAKHVEIVFQPVADDGDDDDDGGADGDVGANVDGDAGEAADDDAADDATDSNADYDTDGMDGAGRDEGGGRQ